MSVIAMGAAPLAPKEPEPAAKPSALTDEKVLLFTCVLFETLLQSISACLGALLHLVTLRYALRRQVWQMGGSTTFSLVCSTLKCLFCCPHQAPHHQA